MEILTKILANIPLLKVIKIHAKFSLNSYQDFLSSIRSNSFQDSSRDLRSNSYQDSSQDSLSNS